MDRWILSSLSTLVRGANEGLAAYDFQAVTSAIHSFWLYDLCDVYLESIKPKLSSADKGLSPSQQQHLDVLLFCVDTGLRILAPFMPYLSEELWQRLPVFANEVAARAPSLAVADYPHGTEFKRFEDEKVKEEVTLMNKLIHAIRSSRSAYNLPNKVKTEVLLLNTDEVLGNVFQEDEETISVLAFSSLRLIQNKDEVPPGAAATVISNKITIYLLLKVSFNYMNSDHGQSIADAFMNSKPLVGV